MIAMPNINKGKISYSVNSQKFLPISFPWSIETNKLSLVNCVNYTPDIDTSISVNYYGNKGDKTQEVLALEAGSQISFFINELKSFDKITSKRGKIKVDSKSVNVYCYVNYYTYNDEDNIIGISSFNKDNEISGASYFINNKKATNKKIKKMFLYIYNLSDSIFDADVKSYSEKGELKKEVSINMLYPNEVKVIRLKGKNNMTYHIIPDNKSLKYASYLKVVYDDEVDTVMPLRTFLESSLNGLTTKTFISNIKDEPVNLSVKVYSNAKEIAKKEINIEPNAQKYINFKKEFKGVKNPYIVLSDNTNSVVAFSQKKESKIAFVDSKEVESRDILIGFNFSLGEKGTLILMNNNSKVASVKVFINHSVYKNIKVPAYAEVSLKLNKLLDRNNLIGYIYLNSNQKLSAKINSKYEKMLEFTANGQTIKDITFEGIETPEYIIK